MATPVSGSAPYATSGTPRWPIRTPDWYAGAANTRLNPPPPSAQAVSPRYVPSAATDSRVPPTANTFGEDAGPSAPAPESPAAATNVTGLWPSGVVKYPFSAALAAVSLPPQLMETTDTPA